METDGCATADCHVHRREGIDIMLLSGVEYLQSLAAHGGFSAKVVFSAKGVVFLPTTQEHR